MNPIAIFACLTLAIVGAIGQHTGGFCYRDSEGCGPGTEEWAKLCHTGKRQSPINLPALGIPFSKIPLKLSAYQGNSFRIQNNGHSVQVDFNNQGPSTQLLAFPDPLQANALYTAQQGTRQYKFSSAHFHWGPNDVIQGSEHCIGGQCAAMEIHFVHYLAKYNSQAEAVASGDESALAVLGVLVHKQLGQTLLGGVSPLNPITRNLRKVEHADHDTSKWTTINEPLNLNKILLQASGMMYTYKGSLTTPGCNEQVNWYVLKGRATTSHQDLEAFRTIVKDGRGITLTDNHRPLQPLNGRKVQLTTVLPY